MLIIIIPLVFLIAFVAMGIYERNEIDKFIKERSKKNKYD
jgi:hypothetical protein